MAELAEPRVVIRSRLQPLPAHAGLGGGLARLRFAAVPLALLGLWQLSASRGLITQLVLPSPLQVWQALAAEIANGELARALTISLRRLLLGYGAGVAIGLPLGALLAISPVARKLISPSFYFIIRVPLLAWIPFLMVLFGIGEALKLIIIAKAALTPVTINTEKAMRGIPPAWRELGTLYRLSPWRLLQRILLPATILPIFTGLRLGLVQSWATLVGVELLASSNGIGFELTMSRQLFQLDSMMALMAVIAVIGLVLDRGLATAERHLAQHFGGAA